MTGTTSSRNQYTLRVTARIALAKTLRLPKHAARVAEVGLVDGELEEIEKHGLAAEKHDREQHVALAEQQNGLAGAAVKWQHFFAEQDALRDRLPAVIRELGKAPATASQATWLENLSFERFRLRTSALPESAQSPGATDLSAQPPAKPARVRVQREDRFSAAQGLAHFTRALLEEQRAPIISALEPRGFGRDRIEKLAATAEAQLATINTPSRMTSPEAGRLEAEAVAAQKQCWEACRRMLRAAVQGDPELEALWAKC